MFAVPWPGWCAQTATFRIIQYEHFAYSAPLTAFRNSLPTATLLHSPQAVGRVPLRRGTRVTVVNGAGDFVIGGTRGRRRSVVSIKSWCRRHFSSLLIVRFLYGSREQICEVDHGAVRAEFVAGRLLASIGSTNDPGLAYTKTIKRPKSSGMRARMIFVGMRKTYHSIQRVEHDIRPTTRRY
jgi:hypothetical protein